MSDEQPEMLSIALGPVSTNREWWLRTTDLRGIEWITQFAHSP